MHVARAYWLRRRLLRAGLTLVAAVGYSTLCVAQAPPSIPGGLRIGSASSDSLKALRAELDTCAAELGAVLDAAPNANGSVKYARAALATARYFGLIADKKSTVGRIQEAVDDVQFLKQLCSEHVTSLRNGRRLPYDENLRLRDFSGAVVTNGEFRVNGRPVMLLGPVGHKQLGEEQHLVSEFGFNAIGDDFNNFASISAVKAPGSVDGAPIARLSDARKSLEQQGLFISFNPTLHYLSPSVVNKFPDVTGNNPPKFPGLYGGFMPYSLASTTMRTVVQDYYDALFAVLPAAPAARFFWLLNEPSYELLTDPAYRQSYRGYLRSKYRDIQTLNDAWTTSFGDFSDVPVDVPGTDTDRYDAAVFRQQYLTQWVQWLHAEVKKRSPNAMVSNKPMAHRLFDLSGGVDFEAEAKLLDVPGSDAYRNPSKMKYGFAWPQPIALYDFQKSVAPNKPLADLEAHYVEEKGAEESYVEAALWQSFLHGVRLATFWVWDTGELDQSKQAPAGMRDTVWAQPRAAWATAKTALDLQRLSDLVATFPLAPQMHIYYSKPSLIASKAAQDTVKWVYEAAAGLGVSIGYVTDDMIRAGALAGIKVLLIPGTKHVSSTVLTRLKEFAASGKHVVVVGSAFTMDEYLREYPSGGGSLTGARVKLFRDVGSSQLAELLNGLVTEAGLERPLTLLNEAGRVAWPIDFRCRREGLRALCYIVGLNKSATRVRMVGTGKVAGWTDWISGATGQSDEIVVNPRNVRLITVDFESG